MIEPSSTCRSPHVALRFSPDGRVHACCVNESYQLGRIGERTIREVWEGVELARLRTALDGADFALGCQDCGMLHATGHREHTQAAAFDRFPQPTGPSWPRRLEFALSNTCNLQCIQCSGDLSSAIRAQREHRPPLRSPYGDEFFDELRSFLPHLEVAVFIGGEPFLTRECRRVWDLLIEMDLHPEVHVTTNATVWDDRVEHYVRSLAMNVCVSIDGATAEVNDAIRLGSDFAEVVAIRDRFRDLTREVGSVFGINHCFMVQNWHELGDVLVEAEGLDADVNVIPVLYPPADSVVCLPRDEVAPVLDALQVQDAAVRPHLDRNLAQWDGILSQLRTIVDGPEAPVELGPRPTLGQRDDDLLAEVEAELRSWAGQDPLRFDTERGVVRAVSGTTGWAAPLAAVAWLDRPAPVILDELRERLGPLVDLELDASPTVRHASCSVRSDEGLVPHRVAVVEWHEGRTRWTRTLVVRPRT